jgi:hypothetical protein
VTNITLLGCHYHVYHPASICEELMDARVRFSSILVLLLSAALAVAQHPDYDFLISGGRIVDGTGAPWVSGDIAVSGDRIVAIGNLSKASAKKRI